MIRVAQVMGYMNGGGVESVVMNYYRHIDRLRVQFDFLVCEGSSMVPREEIETLGGRVFMVPSYEHLPKYMRVTENLFREQCWPIVHSHVNALSVFPLCAAKRAGVPVRIAHSHSTAGKGEYAKNLVKYVLKRFSNRYPTHRFACGEFAGEWLFGKREGFEIVRNAIDLDHFAFNGAIRERVRRQLGISENTFVVGHVGRFVPQKNHAFLVDVFQILHKARPDSLLLLVGEGELKPYIEDKIRDAGLDNCVCFLGQRDDVANLYQAFDVFALPSLYEGLCVVGVEAQCSGLPCVFSDSITKEIHLTDKACFLPIDDAQAWAQILSTTNTFRHTDKSPFDQYDIVTAAKRLGGRYMELAGGVEC